MSTIPTQELVPVGPPVLPSGPPFNDLWTPIPDDPIPPNLWSVQRLDRGTGQLVMQLGTRAPSFTPQSGRLLVGLRRLKVRVRAAGTLHAALQVQPGPVSRRFQGGAMAVETFLIVRRADGSDASVFFQPMVSHTPVTLRGHLTVECGEAWEILIGGVITFRGVQEAYGELIARIASLRVAFPEGYYPCGL